MRIALGLAPRNPFGSSPRLTPDEYRRRYESTVRVESDLAEKIESDTGFRLTREWVNELALHTQVVEKKSSLDWVHGRLLYSFFRRFIQASVPDVENFMVLETGTARGFSAVCLAKALVDSRKPGVVLTLDPLPHSKKIFWNVIDDHDGKRTRQTLLNAWSVELEHIVFITGTSRRSLPRLGIGRIHFAFLDAQHTKKEVIREFKYVQARQLRGDMLFFDDVTPGRYDGVVEAVDDVEASGLYSVTRYFGSDSRGYAVAVRTS